MSILSLPTGIVPNAMEWSLKSNTQSFSSQLNGVTQTRALPGDIWTANLTFANRIGTKANQIRAFVASLRGRSGRFYLTPFDHRIPSGTALGSPLVKGAGQSGSTLLVDGLTPSQSQCYLPGDYFQVGNELKMITATAATNGSGETTLQFVPPLRVSPADNAAIITTNPTCVMFLSDDNQARWQAQPGDATNKLYALTLACEEALDI